jgi:DNA-binding SARP family transcriptional activator
VVDSAKMRVESAQVSRARSTHSVEVRMLGRLTICRHDVTLTLPSSCKVRGLFAYLSLAPHAVVRSKLRELLWDVPNDPRGELRRCVSKIRGLVDEPGRKRVDTEADTVRLDLADCFVDAIEIARAVKDVKTFAPEQLKHMNMTKRSTPKQE